MGDIFELIEYCEKLRRAKRKWYQTLWEDYVSVFLFFAVPIGILIGIGIILGKFVF